MEYLLYIKSYCPYSQEALKQLKKNNKKFKSIDITDIGTSNCIKKLKSKSLLEKNCKHNTVPIVFKIYKNIPFFIGGCSDLKKHLGN